MYCIAEFIYITNCRCAQIGHFKTLLAQFNVSIYFVTKLLDKVYQK